VVDLNSFVSHYRENRFMNVFVMSAFILLLAGCPDYSHLREAPDYSTMTDSAVEEFADE
jgi:hypothetical protein